MFNDGDTITIEPFRGAFPVVKDLVVDRSAFDRIQHAGGFISVNTSGNPVDANAIPINKRMLTLLLMQRLVLVVVFVATCKNSSAMLFVAAYPSTLCYLKVES
jgi:succinate dehydrogenase / fumarate reductase iron-sulfur subunit